MPSRPCTKSDEEHFNPKLPIGIVALTSERHVLLVLVASFIIDAQRAPRITGI